MLCYPAEFSFPAQISWSSEVWACRSCSQAAQHLAVRIKFNLHSMPTRKEKQGNPSRLSGSPRVPQVFIHSFPCQPYKRNGSKLCSSRGFSLHIKPRLLQCIPVAPCQPGLHSCTHQSEKFAQKRGGNVPSWTALC